MSDAEIEPFDELAYLALLDRVREDQERGPCMIDPQDLARLLHLTPQLIAENIRLRQRAREARTTAELLEQGQGILCALTPFGADACTAPLSVKPTLHTP